VRYTLILSYRKWVIAGMTVELWLIRHGETDWNKQGLYQGQSDIPLNEAGLEQARQVAQYLAEARVDFSGLYSSPLARARQTAEESARCLGLPILSEPRLREIHQGEWQGKNYAAIVAQYSGLMAQSQADPLNTRAPGGESVAEVAERMAAAADEIAREHPGERVLVFSHGFALAVLVCLARSIPLAEVYEHIPGNGAAEVIEWPAVKA
jgi:probable phosphoglycerate mutase